MTASSDPKEISGSLPKSFHDGGATIVGIAVASSVAAVIAYTLARRSRAPHPDRLRLQTAMLAHMAEMKANQQQDIRNTREILAELRTLKATREAAAAKLGAAAGAAFRREFLNLCMVDDMTEAKCRIIEADDLPGQSATTATSETPPSSAFLGDEALVYGKAEEKRKALNWAQQFPGHSDSYWRG